MKYLICLIFAVKILAVTFENQNLKLSRFADDEKVAYYFEQTTNPPLSAIENPFFSLNPVNFDYKNYAGSKINFNQYSKAHSGFLLTSNKLKTANLFLSKGTSLFLLFHSSISLLKVILC